MPEIILIFLLHLLYKYIYGKFVKLFNLDISSGPLFLLESKVLIIGCISFGAFIE